MGFSHHSIIISDRFLNIDIQSISIIVNSFGEINISFISQNGTTLALVVLFHYVSVILTLVWWSPPKTHKGMQDMWPSNGIVLGSDIVNQNCSFDVGFWVQYEVHGVWSMSYILHIAGSMVWPNVTLWCVELNEIAWVRSETVLV